MKIKSVSKIFASAVSAFIVFGMAAVPSRGNSLLSVRVGENYVISNDDTDKQVGISAGGEIIDTLPVGICLRGDANSDNATDVFDAIAVARYTVGTLDIKNFEGSIGEFAGNVNEDGSLDVFDAVSIAKFTVCGEPDTDKAWDIVLGRK
ncbi:MAG: hypothetical protein ACI4I9_09010 [Porcipelethomonas sp.]